MFFIVPEIVAVNEVLKELYICLVVMKKVDTGAPNVNILIFMADTVDSSCFKLFGLFISKYEVQAHTLALFGTTIVAVISTLCKSEAAGNSL